MAARIPTREAVKAERCRRSFPYFIAQAWPIVEPGTDYVRTWHVDEIAEHLEAVTEGGILRLLINIPPRHMKSLLVGVFWPAWEWTRLDTVSSRWLCASYAQTLSTRDAVKTRRLITSPWYRALFGDGFDLAGDQNVKTRYDNTEGGYRIATSVGGSATGEGGDRLVIDDPHKASDAHSDTIREGALDWYRETWSTRKNDPKTAVEVVVMQRLHEQDLSGHLLAVGGWEHLCLPARYVEARHSETSVGGDRRSTEGDLLCSERFGEAELAVLEAALGSYGASGQLQQSPSPGEGGMLKRAWWKRYTSLPQYLDEWALSWDMAFKDTKASDYVVGQVWARKGADRYLVHQERGRMDFPATVAAVRALAERFPQAGLKLIEDKANGPAVIATLQHEVPGLVPVEPEGSKVARAAAVSPQIEAGNVYLPETSVATFDVEAFIDECARFPLDKHDDQVDGMTQVLRRFQGGTISTISGGIYQ